MDTKKIERVARQFRVTSHPERSRIIQILDENGKLNVTQIYGKMKMKQAEASHHLTLLLKYDILKKVRQGKMSIYSLNMPVLEKIIKYSEDLSKRV
jgi:DNA-binding transcriptional ArsR family regulator